MSEESKSGFAPVYAVSQTAFLQNPQLLSRVSDTEVSRLSVAWRLARNSKAFPSLVALRESHCLFCRSHLQEAECAHPLPAPSSFSSSS